MGLGIKIPKSALQAGREKFASGDENDNIDLEPGKYMFQAVKGRGIDTKNGPQIVFDFQLVGEDKKGKIGIFYSLAEDRVVYLFKFFALLGYDVSELDENMLEELVADIEKNKPVVRIKVSKKDEFTNYRVEKLIEDISFLGGESAVDTDAGAVTAGRDVEQVKPAATQIAKPAPVAAPVKPAPVVQAKPTSISNPTPTVPVAAPKAAPAKISTPATPSSEEEAVVEDEVVEEPVVDEQVELKVGLKCKANLKIGMVDVEITDIHEAENKVTAKCLTAGESLGKKFKFDLEKLA